jgi:hypothetical protein
VIFDSNGLLLLSAWKYIGIDRIDNMYLLLATIYTLNPIHPPTSCQDPQAQPHDNSIINPPHPPAHPLRPVGAPPPLQTTQFEILRHDAASHIRPSRPHQANRPSTHPHYTRYPVFCDQQLEEISRPRPRIPLRSTDGLAVWSQAWREGREGGMGGNLVLGILWEFCTCDGCLCFQA